MLLAVVLDRYIRESQALTKVSAPTIWAQMTAFCRRTWEQRGYIPMHKLEVELDSHGHTAHPQDTVTNNSLRAAFPKMPENQVQSLLAWLEDEARLRMKKDRPNEMTERAVRTERIL